MASLNKVLLIGNLTLDPEHRDLGNTTITKLRLAVNESYTNKAGEKVEKAVFLDVDVWDRQADACAKYLAKGSPVFVEGKLQLDDWEDKATGEKRSRLKVRAERVQFLSSQKDGGKNDEPKASTLASAPVADEDIPF